MEVPQKIIELLHDIANFLWVYIQNNESRVLNTYLCDHVHNSIILQSQKGEVTPNTHKQMNGNTQWSILYILRWDIIQP